MINRRNALIALKVAIGLSLLGFLYTQAPLPEIQATIQSASLGALSGALVFYFLASIAEFWKFRAATFWNISIIVSAKLVLTGLFFNNFLPSNIGGDAYKYYWFRSQGIRRSVSAAYPLLDRITSLLVLIFLGFAAFLLQERTWIREYIQLDPATLIGLSILALALVLLGSIIFYIKRAVIFDRLGDLKSIDRNALLKAIIGVAIFAIVFHLLRACALISVVSSLGGTLEFGSTVLILSVVAIFSMLPISIGGLGVREGVLATLMIGTGISTPVALAATAFNLAILWFKSLLGGAIFLRESGKSR